MLALVALCAVAGGAAGTFTLAGPGAFDEADVAFPGMHGQSVLRRQLLGVGPQLVAHVRFLQRGRRHCRPVASVWGPWRPATGSCPPTLKLISDRVVSTATWL